MISINISRDFITVKGHAKPIACEAITAVSQTVIGYLNEIGVKVHYKLISGYFEINTAAARKQAPEIVKYLEYALTFIATGYPDDIKVINT